MNKVLDSKYIIDGLPKEFSPAQILGLQPTVSDGTVPSTIIDETVDTPSDPFRRTKLSIAETLIGSLWLKGHFNIGDLCVSLCWKGDSGKMGIPAAIYESTEQAAEYIEGLGIFTKSAEFIESDVENLEVTVGLSSCCGRQDEYFETPFQSKHPALFSTRFIREFPVRDASSWIVFVPFDTNAYSCHEPVDTDYFIDCFEVIREMVEDGIIMSAETKTIGNIPGAVIQIADTDFDYIDAEFLLQDVAYYPVGHPSEDGTLPNIEIGQNSGIQKILSSLIQSRSAEAED